MDPVDVLRVWIQIVRLTFQTASRWSNYSGICPFRKFWYQHDMPYCLNIMRKALKKRSCSIIDLNRFHKIGIWSSHQRLSLSIMPWYDQWSMKLLGIVYKKDSDWENNSYSVKNNWSNINQWPNISLMYNNRYVAKQKWCSNVIMHLHTITWQCMLHGRNYYTNQWVINNIAIQIERHMASLAARSII